MEEWEMPGETYLMRKERPYDDRQIYKAVRNEYIKTSKKVH